MRQHAQQGLSTWLGGQRIDGRPTCSNSRNAIQREDHGGEAARAEPAHQRDRVATEATPLSASATGAIRITVKLRMAIENGSQLVVY